MFLRMKDNASGEFRSGFVAVVGLPNVGKSTLLNALTGESLSIVTARPQTTRQRVTAILTTGSHQAVFVDTPGLLEPRYLLHESMNSEVHGAITDMDVLLYVVDAGFARSVQHAHSFERAGGAPSVLCLNKVDRLKDREVERLWEEFEATGRWDAIVATVATEGSGVDALRRAVLDRLPVGPAYYPEDELATAPVRFFVAEKIRAVCFEELGQELPYSLAIAIEEYREGSDPLYIGATIYIERESQKGMVIGKGGRTVRRIGTRARASIEEFVGQQVYLDLRVKVLANWRKNPARLKLLGYSVPSA